MKLVIMESCEKQNEKKTARGTQNGSPESREADVNLVYCIN